MYRVTFFNKYNWTHSISIKNVTEEECKKIQGHFNKEHRRVFTQELHSQIDLDNVGYVKYELM